MKVELLIIGGGPAGLSTAYSAAKHGIDVLVIEKRREIGVPIQCGEFLPARSEYNNILPNAKHIKLLKSIPKEIILTSIRKISMFSPSGDRYDVRFDGCVVDRERFDKWIAVLAGENNAKIALSTKALSIDLEKSRVYVTGKYFDGWIYYEYLVYAAGAISNLDNYIPIKPKNSEYNISRVYQVVMGNASIDEDTIYMFSGLKYAPGAYAWIIPRGSSIANVGLGVRKPYNPKPDLEIYIKNLRSEHPVAKSMIKSGTPLSYIGGLVPVGPPLKSAVYGNVLLVGDSANMTVASIGAGVPTAVVAGSICGEVISNHPNDIYKYDELWRQEILSPLENGYKIRVMMDPVLKSDLLMDLALKVLGEKFLGDIIRVKIPKEIEILYKLFKLRFQTKSR